MLSLAVASRQSPRTFLLGANVRKTQHVWGMSVVPMWSKSESLCRSTPQRQSRFSWIAKHIRIRDRFGRGSACSAVRCDRCASTDAPMGGGRQTSRRGKVCSFKTQRFVNDQVSPELVTRAGMDKSGLRRWSQTFLWRTVETIHRTVHMSHTQTFFSRVAQGASRSQSCFFCLSKNSHFRERMSCFAPCLITHLSRCSTTLWSLSPFSSEQDKSLCIAIRTPVWPFCRTEPAHKLWAQRSFRGEQYRGYDYALTVEKSKHWFDLQLRRGHRHNPCCIRGEWKIRFGNAGLTTVNTGERDKCDPIQSLSPQWNKFWDTCITRSYQFGEARGYAHTRKNQVEMQMSCRSLVQKEKTSFYASRNPRFLWNASWSCWPMRKSDAPSRLSGAEYHTRLLLEERKNHLLSWSPIRAGYARNEGGRCRQSSSRIRSRASLSKDGTLPRESVIWLFQEREELAMHRIGKKRKRSSRGSCEKSSRKIEKVMLCRSWKSQTIEDRWTFFSRERRPFYSESAYGSNSGTTRQCEFPERC